MVNLRRTLSHKQQNKRRLSSTGFIKEEPLTFSCRGWAAGAWPERSRTGCRTPRPSWWRDWCPGWRRAPSRAPPGWGPCWRKAQWRWAEVSPRAAAAAASRLCPGDSTPLVRSSDPGEPPNTCARCGDWLRGGLSGRCSEPVPTAPLQARSWTAPLITAFVVMEDSILLLLLPHI